MEDARAAGFSNISLDLMLGAAPEGPGKNWGGPSILPAGLGVEHISSYILKVEPGTPFARQGVERPRR